MSDNDESRESRLIEDNKSWNKVIVKHAIAWLALLVMAIVIWNMAGPIINPDGSEESTSTAASINEGNAGTENTISLPSGENRVQVLVDSLDIREKAEEQSKKIGTLSKGTVVQAIEVEGKWVKIKTVDSKIGYISANSTSVRKAP